MCNFLNIWANLRSFISRSGSKAEDGSGKKIRAVMNNKKFCKPDKKLEDAQKLLQSILSLCSSIVSQLKSNLVYKGT